MDPDMNTVFTQTRVSAATAKLPEEVKRLGVTTQKSLPNIMQAITLTSPMGATTSSSGQLRADRHQGRAGPPARCGPRGRDGRQRLLHAHLGEARPAGQDAHRGGGDRRRHPAAERDRARRQVRRRARATGTELTYTVRMPDRLQTEDAFGAIVVRTARTAARCACATSPGWNWAWRTTSCSPA